MAAKIVSQRFEYVEITEDGDVRGAGRDPHIDLRAPEGDEQELLAPLVEADWVRAGLEVTALRHATEHNAPQHLAEVQERVYCRVDRTLAAVEHRLKEEIRYWDRQVLELKDKELAGKSGARLNSALARRRADEAEERLQRRRAELALQRKLSVRQPRVVGGALVVPAGLLARLAGDRGPRPCSRHDANREARRGCGARFRTCAEQGPHRDAPQQRGLRHRDPSRGRSSAVHRGEGPSGGRRPLHGHQSRTQLRTEQRRAPHLWP